MGLDVYLYRYDRPLSEVLASEKEWEEKSSAFGKALEEELGLKWDTSPTSVKQEFFRRQKAWYAENGLNEYGEVPEREKIELPSPKHPDHYFKVGYFRSSYNESGVNRVMQQRIGVALDDIFEATNGDGNRYEREVDWEACRSRAVETLRLFVESCEKTGAFVVEQFNHNPFMGLKDLPADERSALKLFIDELAKERPADFSNFSSSAGSFFLRGNGELMAVIRGKQGACFGMAAGHEPCVFVVTKQLPDEKGAMWWHWYRDALEVCIETCDWVLAQPNPERFLLHWSG